MPPVLTFESTCVDLQQLRPAELGPARSLRFMTGTLPSYESPGSSVAAQHEAALLRWVVSHHVIPRQTIERHLGLPQSTKHFFSVVKPILPPGCTKPGDVDWLCVDPAMPCFATAAECKRVKVVARRGDHDQVNKIESLGEGVIQANSLAEHGFHRAFLVIMIVVDGRECGDNNMITRGMRNETFQRVYEFPQKDSLNDEVGVAYIEVVQPSQRPVDSMVKISVCVDRRARPREQSREMTNRVREFLRIPG